MTDHTLREKIAALRRNPGDWSDPESAAEYNGALDDVLCLLAESERPAQCCMCGKKGLSTVEGDGGPECQLDDDRWTCSRECWDRATAQPAPDALAEASIADDANLFRQISELGNQIHNLGCEYQNDEKLLERLEELRSTAWELATLAKGHQP